VPPQFQFPKYRLEFTRKVASYLLLYRGVEWHGQKGLLSYKAMGSRFNAEFLYFQMGSAPSWL